VAVVVVGGSVPTARVSFPLSRMVPAPRSEVARGEVAAVPQEVALPRIVARRVVSLAGRREVALPHELALARDDVSLPREVPLAVGVISLPGRKVPLPRLEVSVSGREIARRPALEVAVSVPLSVGRRAVAALLSPLVATRLPRRHLHLEESKDIIKLIRTGILYGNWRSTVTVQAK
jgi:hypothetical protein